MNNNNEEKNNEYKKLKELLIEQTFFSKYTAKNYEIPFNLFKEIEIDRYGNCLNYQYFLYIHHNYIFLFLILKITTLRLDLMYLNILIIIKKNFINFFKKMMKIKSH